MNTRNRGFIAIATAAFVCGTFAGEVLAGQGNGSPNGKHFNLNVIGVSKEKKSAMDDSQRHTIFVPLQGKCKINLAEGEDFSVLDGNCFDGPAAFELPNPDPDGDGETTYSVFVRALGKPNGSSVTTTCATDPDDDSTVCSVVPLTLTRTKGKQTFQNATKELLYIYADVDGDASLERVPLFGDELEDYYWDYDNNGLRLAQFRFYECVTIVPDPTDPNGGVIDSDCF